MQNRQQSAGQMLQLPNPELGPLRVPGLHVTHTELFTFAFRRAPEMNFRTGPASEFYHSGGWIVLRNAWATAGYTAMLWNSSLKRTYEEHGAISCFGGNQLCSGAAGSREPTGVRGRVGSSCHRG